MLKLSNMKMRIKHLFIVSLGFVVVAGLMSSCQSSGTKTKGAEEKLIESASKVDAQLMENFNKSKLIFYSLPSPLETAMLIKKSGARFDADILNPTKNASKYSTNLKMAVNLGIYGADLSYTSLFDQTQSSIQYMAASKKLADGLNILDIIDENTLKNIEENMNNRDAIIDIVSESFMNSHSYLKENDRPIISTEILVGGWIEGLYLATSLTNGSMQNNKRLLDRIVYQKLSLITVINLIESHEENEDLTYLKNKMLELQDIFEQIKIVNTSNVIAETDASRRTTTIKADSETYISEETFKQLINKVSEIRTEFIS